MIDWDTQIRWLFCVATLLVCGVKSGVACAQSVPAPLEPLPELTFNFSDGDADSDGYSNSKLMPTNSAATTAISTTAAATPPIELNLTDQPSLDHCKRAANLVRAGYSHTISKRAATTYNEKYEGYYVGGGVPPTRFKKRSRGEPCYRDEGTWGMDYSPFFTRVAANWSHGRFFQGGIGQYEPDHKNRPFGQTFGKHFGNRDRRFESVLVPAEHQAEPVTLTPDDP